MQTRAIIGTLFRVKYATGRIEFIEVDEPEPSAKDTICAYCAGRVASGFIVSSVSIMNPVRQGARVSVYGSPAFKKKLKELQS